MKRGFTMIPNEVLLDASLSPNAKIVGGVVASASWGLEPRDVTVELIASNTGLGRSAIMSALKTLRERGYVEGRYERAFRGRRQVYRLAQNWGIEDADGDVEKASGSADALAKASGNGVDGASKSRTLSTATLIRAPGCDSRRKTEDQTNLLAPTGDEELETSARVEPDGLFSPAAADPLPWERDPLVDDEWSPEYAIYTPENMKHIVRNRSDEQIREIIERWRHAPIEDEVFTFWRDLSLNFGVALTPAARTELRKTLKTYGVAYPVLKAVVGARRDEWLRKNAPSDFARVIATAQKTKAGLIDNVARYGAAIGSDELSDALHDAAMNRINWIAWERDRIDEVEDEFAREHRKLLQRDNPRRYRRFEEARAERLSTKETV